MWSEKLDFTCKRIKLSPYLTPLARINWQCIKDLNASSETIKLIEEDIRKTLLDESWNDFLDITSKHNQPKQKSISGTTSS